MLYGRLAEQAALEGLLTGALEGSGGSLLLRGESGIGKSALLDWTADAAAERGMRIVRATGVESEAQLPLAGLVQMVWPLKSYIDNLPPVQAGALHGVLGAEAAPGIDRLLIGLATLMLVADVAEREPVLCIVDDAHWLDRSTSDALTFAARRLVADRAVMLFAARDDDFPAAGLPERRIPALGSSDAHRILADHNLPPHLRQQVVADSAGNPLALIEFARASRERPPRVLAGPAPLPVAESVLATYRQRIATLPESAQTVLLLAAAGARDPAALAAAARELRVGIDDLQPVEQALLLRSTADQVAFPHPLIATAAYQGASLAQRLAVHRAIADTTNDFDTRAHHLMAATTEPDEDVAAELAAAAERARCRAAYPAATQLFHRASQLTYNNDRRATWLTAAAGAAATSCDYEQALDLARRAEPLTNEPAKRATLARIRASVEFEQGRPDRAAELLVADAAGPEAPVMLRDAAGYAWFSGRPGAIQLAAERLAALGVDDLGVRGMAFLIQEDYARGLPLLAAHVTHARGSPPAEGTDLAGRMPAVYSGIILGDDVAVLDLVAEELEHCRRSGLVARLPRVLQAQAQTQFRVGLLADAAASISEAAVIARDAGSRRRNEELDVALAWIAAVEGDERRCLELTRRSTDTSRVAADAALSLLDLGLGRFQSALDRLDAAWKGPGRHTAVLMASIADLVEAAVRLGCGAEIEPRLRRFEAWAQHSGQMWAQAVAARCSALLAGDENDYRRALSLHARATRPFERARTELAYGEWLRRTGQRTSAREPLWAALDTFERLNATPWISRARAELAAAGESGGAARTAAASLLDRLTPQERQVVRLAAEGHTSREIGARLFLSQRTIEYHLYKAYPKLGVSNRRALASLHLSSPSATLAP